MGLLVSAGGKGPKDNSLGALGMCLKTSWSHSTKLGLPIAAINISKQDPGFGFEGTVQPLAEHRSLCPFRDPKFRIEAELLGSSSLALQAGTLHPTSISSLVREGNLSLWPSCGGGVACLSYPPSHQAELRPLPCEGGRNFST
jgi:hypothetical protein